MIANNADWLRSLNYIDFLRDVGALFSVNRMLTAECYKQRLERGLTFLEFNYMLMQSYDFLELNHRYGCILQTGGDDQWSNMLSGADLIRRKDQKPAFALTFKLLLTHDGRKMGKTEKGALWLDANKCSPYDFYQYWRNVDDADVEKCLGLLTFLPMDEVRRLGALQGSEINEAKRVLAFEVTKLIHGEEEADQGAAGGGSAVRRRGNGRKYSDDGDFRSRSRGGRAPDFVDDPRGHDEIERRSAQGGSAGRRFGQRRKDCGRGFCIHGGNAFRRRRAGQEGQEELPALCEGVNLKAAGISVAFCMEVLSLRMRFGRQYQK